MQAYRQTARQRAGGERETIRRVFPRPSELRRGAYWLVAALMLGRLLTPAARALPPCLSMPGSFPYGLAYDGRVLWCTDFGEHALYRVDLKKRDAVRAFELPVSEAAGLCFADGKLWFAADGGVFQLDPQSGLCRRWRTWSHGTPTGLACDGKRLFVADRAERQVTVFNLENRRIAARFDTPGRWPRGMTYHDDSLWLVDSADRAVYRLCPETGQLQGAFVTPEGEPRGIEFVDGLWWFSLRKGRILAATRAEPLGADVPANAMRSNPLRVRVRFVAALENTLPKPIRDVSLRLAVPPETARQQIEQLQFDPQPTELRTDRFGQHVAVYGYRQVEAGEKLRASWTAVARVWAIRYTPDWRAVRPVTEAPEPIRSLFTQDAGVLRLDAPAIRRAASEVRAGAQNGLALAEAIRNHVMSRIRYVRDGAWDPAPVVLKRGTGSCSEYSYVFTALARANGLPVRFVGATAFRGTLPFQPRANSKRKHNQASSEEPFEDRIFHRWVEVYVPPFGWLPLDVNRDDRPKPPFPRRYFLALTERLLVLSKTSWGDRQNLGSNYHATFAFELGENTASRSGVKTERVATWQLLPDADLWDRPVSGVLDRSE